MKLRVCPPMLVKTPPTKILPSACTAIATDKIVRVRVEGGVERAVRVQPGNAVARDRRSAVGRERCKTSAEKNLAVRLDDDDDNLAVRVRIETIERGLPAHRRHAARQEHGHGKQEERGFSGNSGCGSRQGSERCDVSRWEWGTHCVATAADRFVSGSAFLSKPTIPR